ncbi:hypothetical protein [Paenibacillus rhizovicinus]|uniref:hypothetical protein n=1 Tax=Paenibacillus rhizovicinus TaxID=2704463 RepID=UPI00177CB123|nr:hypothetical protein [Paenibacillus rhizovicinus]
MFHRRGKKNGRGLKLVVGIVCVLLLWITWRGASSLWTSDNKDQASEVVEQFYTFEQAGDFGSAWELFHPLMKERFEKAAYIQKRAHIMMQDFGVTTFQFKAGSPVKLRNWKMSDTAVAFPEAYEVTVTELFHSPYGNFKLVQSCYAVYDAGTWKIMWSYREQEM